LCGVIEAEERRAGIIVLVPLPSNCVRIQVRQTLEGIERLITGFGISPPINVRPLARDIRPYGELETLHQPIGATSTSGCTAQVLPQRAGLDVAEKRKGAVLHDRCAASDPVRFEAAFPVPCF